MIYILILFYQHFLSFSNDHKPYNNINFNVKHSLFHICSRNIFKLIIAN